MLKSFSSSESGKNELILLVVLSSIQFTNLLDFVIMMPLGPQLMRVFSISPKEFGLVVSSYTFAAGIAGFVGAFLIDRFDRKTALLALYGGFTVGTFLCSVAPSYPFLLAARGVTGTFAGIMGATVFAVIGDAIPDSRRGAAMGMVMSSFSAATVFGVPIGLFLANHWGWHMPFYLLAALSLAVLIVGSRVLPPMKAHISSRREEGPLEAVKYILTHPNHLSAFVFIMAMMIAGFSVIPYLSPYLVQNVGLKETDLPYIYLCGGALTIFTSRFIGKLADRHGKVRVFTFIATLSMIPILLVTNLPVVSLPLALVVTTTFMVLMSGRMVPAMAIITASVEAKRRGSFMSIISSVQQLSAGVAAFGAGLILGKSESGLITRFDVVGVLAAITTVVCIVLIRRIQNVETARETLPQQLNPEV